MSLFSKKFIAGFILLLICLGIFFPVFSFTSPAAAFYYQTNYYPPGVDEKMTQTVKDSGAGEPGLVTGAVLKAANYILYAISWFAGKIITIEASILNWILNPDNFRLATAPIVKSGWDVTRTTVNMFFVLVLLVVAFATILRIETYSLKAILPRLIIVALLINFSLVIAGAILDFANVMTNFFYQSLTQQSLGSNCKDIGCHLQNGLKVTNFLQPNQEAQASFWAGVGNFGSGLLMAFAGILLGTIFLMATIFIFAALIVLMLVRILYLWILLILAPAAWFFYIVPAWQSQWYKWWSNFFRWAFFAPIAMFFIYLSIVSLSNMKPKSFDNVNLGTLSEAARQTTNSKTDATANPVEAIFQFAIGTGLILGSLMVANSMSITGADVATKLGKSGAKGLGAWAGRKAQMPTSRLAGKAGELMDKGVGKIPGLRQLSRPFHRYAESGRQYEKKLEDQYKNKSTEYLTSLHGKVDDPKKRAIESVLAGKGVLDKVLKNPDDIKRAAERAFKGGNKDLARSIIKFDPTVAEKISQKMLGDIMGESVKSVNDVLRGLKPDDWAKMNSGAFESLSPQLIQTARGAHISKLAEQGEFAKIDKIQTAIKNTTESQLTATNAGFVKYIKSQAGNILLSPDFKSEHKGAPFTTG